jgi:uncharacterized protein YqcC (DUF446 family)
MKRIGMWQSTPLPAAAYEFRKAFGMDTMAFSQWLQFIFIPRVRDLIRTGAAFPSSSMVGAQAVRESDTVPDTGELVQLLSTFDALFR